MPITNKVIIPIGEPKRGDIVVFKYPANQEVDFIKRLVGLPGDKISYVNKELFINGKKIPKSFVGNILQPSNSATEESQEYREKLRIARSLIIDLGSCPNRIATLADGFASDAHLAGHYAPLLRFATCLAAYAPADMA